VTRTSPSDRSRFEAEVLPYLDSAYRFARWLTRAPAEADDLVQESMLRAFRAFGTLRGGNARAWLLAIVRNCHSTSLRERQRNPHVALPDGEDAADFGGLSRLDAAASESAGPESLSILRDERRTLERLIAALPQEHREVLVLREIEDMDYRSIAAVTGLPMGTVMSRLARARAALRARWLKEIEGVPHAVR
jgi:RNA polymerase sigma-70 factor, ECF subfamily